LGVSVAAVLAVDEVESAGAGFDEQGRVKLLFEPHWFHKLTGGIFADSHPALSCPAWNPKSPSYQRDQHQVLAEARALVPAPGQSSVRVDDAAVQACSWGRYQVMGFNWRLAGARSLAAFEAQMRTSEAEHLAAFVSFVRSHREMLAALQAQDWPGFARRYNGPGYAANRYDTKLAAAFARHSKGA
jgi:hypothetical protein